MHESNFYITGFSYGSNTHDAVGRVSRSRTYFDVIATTASNWILIVIASRWILAITTSGRPCRPEFQHSPPPLGYGYWPPPWAPLAGGQAPPWGMSPWTIPTPQPQQLSSSPQIVRHLWLLSIVTFVIRANVEQLANSCIYVFKRPSSSAGRDFTDAVLNVGGSGEGDDGGTGNDVTS
jgi:hypothetical protein